MKVREVIARLVADGWYEDRQNGSHKQFKHPKKPGLVTVSDHPGDMLLSDIISIQKKSGVRLR